MDLSQLHMMAMAPLPHPWPLCSQLLRQVGAVNRFLHHLQQPAVLAPHDLLADSPNDGTPRDWDRLGL